MFKLERNNCLRCLSLCGVAAWALLACGSNDRATDAAQPFSGGEAPAAEAEGGTRPNVGAAGAAANTPGDSLDRPPAEREVAFSFELPAASERYVYAANPAANSVVVIDSETLALQTVQAGDGPTLVSTLAGRDEAVVLNVRSDDATLIRTEDAVSRTVTVPVVGGSNAIAAAPDGRHVIAYFDVAQRVLSGSGSFQDLSVILVEDGRSVDMTVGFRPTAVSFSADASQAFVTTEAGVSILDFDEIAVRGSHIARTVSLGGGAGGALDVSVTPDGKFALAREEATAVLTLAGLADEADPPSSLDLASLFPPPDAANPQLPPVVTDLDLSADGSQALAVLRNRQALVLLPLPEAFDDPSLAKVLEFPDEDFGSVSVSGAGERAVLYTTDAAVERVTIVELGTGEGRTVRLSKSVLAISIAPSGASAMVIHQKVAGDPAEVGLDADALVDRSYGYSLVKLDDGFSKLQLTTTPVGPTTLVPTGEYAFIAFRDATLGVQQVQRVGLENFLVDTVELGSPPLNIGVLPSTRKVFVGQEHPDGRITFIDWETFETESVTGFELNSRIRE